MSLQATVATRRDLRSGNNCFHIPVTRLNLGTFAYPIRAARLWNNLPVSVTNNNVSIALFKTVCLTITCYLLRGVEHCKVSR